jgi:DNA-binding transcriptional ArsR family regulator
MSTELTNAQNEPASTSTSTDTRTFPEPVAHGYGVSHVLADENTLYEHCRDLWFDRIGRPEEQPEHGVVLATWNPEFLPGEYDLRFRSSRWKAGMSDESGEWTQWHKYHLTLRRRSDASKTPPISLNIVIEPQVRGLTYKDGNEVSLPYGEGTRVSIQTTYPDGPEEPVDRAFSAIDAVASGVVSREDYQPDTARLHKVEAHIRFDIGRKNAVVKTIDNTRDVLAFGGDADLDAHQTRSREGYVETLLTSDRWDRLGFDPIESDADADPSEQLLKCYQAGDWADRADADPMHHPKLEAAMDGGTVPLSDYSAVLSSLRSKVVNHARWAGVTPADLVSDPFYSGPDAPREHYPEVGDRREDLRSVREDYQTPILQQATRVYTDAPHDIMQVLVAESGATYDTLEDRTGLARRSIQYHVKRFEDLGFVERIGKPVVVVFDSVAVLDLAEDVMDSVHAEETPGDRRADLRERAEERREERKARAERDAEESGFDADGETETPTNDGSKQSVWHYFEQMGITPDDLAARLDRGDLSGRDVRVRSSPSEADPPPSTATAD